MLLGWAIPSPTDSHQSQLLDEGDLGDPGWGTAGEPGAEEPHEAH